MSIKQGGKTIAGATQYHPDLFDFKWADHILDDAQWLMANPFSWQYGSMYQAAYQHLADEFISPETYYAWTDFNEGDIVYTKSSTPSVGDNYYNINTEVLGTITEIGVQMETITAGGATYTRTAGSDFTVGSFSSETVAGITVQFYLADDGHKICPASEESNVLAIYNKTGNAWYYIIDTTNQRFKLPRRHSQKIVRSVKNADGSWYRLYADGWVEQGGIAVVPSGGVAITLPVAMSNSVYGCLSTAIVENIADGVGLQAYGRATTSFYLRNKNYGSALQVNATWQVSGQSAIDMSSFQDGEKYLYFYVGAFTQTAIENTAGLNTELFNQKADLDLSNTASNIDFVVESQEPTAGNNYTWYRKYKSGWVEQGGRSTGLDRTITLPITMSDANYTILTEMIGNIAWQGYSHGVLNITTTGFRCFYDGDQIDPSNWSWQVSGMAAN